MIVYFIALLLSLLAQKIPVGNDKQYRKRLFFTFLPIFLYGVLRRSIGDGEVYEEQFYLIKQSTDIFSVYEHFEPGYVILNKIMPSYGFFIVFMTGLMCFSYGYVLYKNLKPENLWLATLLLYLLGGNTFYFVLGSYRNGIGLCFFMLSLPLLQQRKLIPYLIMTALATSIHTSMLYAMGLAYLVTMWNDISKKESVFWAGALIFFVVASESSMLSFITPFINDNFDRYDSVLEALEEHAGHKGVLNYTASVIMMLFIYSMMKSHAFEKDFNCICRLGMFFCLANIMGPWGGRNPQCFCLFFIVVVAEFLSRIKDNKYRIPFICFTILYSAYFYYLFSSTEYFAVKHLVYHSIFGDI